jgi:hypothetical protein
MEWLQRQCASPKSNEAIALVKIDVSGHNVWCPPQRA